MIQSRRMSLIDTVTNVTLEYALAVTTQIVVFPWFGLQASLGGNPALGGVFTGISLLRSYALRRLFEAAQRR
jgi:ribulose kinase